MYLCSFISQAKVALTQSATFKPIWTMTGAEPEMHEFFMSIFLLAWFAARVNHASSWVVSACTIPVIIMCILLIWGELFVRIEIWESLTSCLSTDFFFVPNSLLPPIADHENATLFRWQILHVSTGLLRGNLTAACNWSWLLSLSPSIPQKAFCGETTMFYAFQRLARSPLTTSLRQAMACHITLPSAQIDKLFVHKWRGQASCLSIKVPEAFFPMQPHSLLAMAKRKSQVACL